MSEPAVRVPASVDWPNSLRVGFHLSIAGGPARLFRRFDERGCTAFQMFLGSPRSWEVAVWSDDWLAAFREERCRRGSPPIVAHTRYLLNLASRHDEVRARSIATLRAEYRSAARLGADFLVLHMGSHPERGQGLKLMQEGLIRALAEVAGPHPLLLLENTAGEANDLGTAPADLATVRAGLPFPTGVCWDTCHAFQAGFDFTTAAGRLGLERALVRAFGTDEVAVVHLNDAMFPRGRGRDRHAALDQGHIGAEALAAFLRSPLLRGATVIFETPQPDGPDDPSADLANRDRLHRAFLATRSDVPSLQVTSCGRWRRCLRR